MSHNRKDYAALKNHMHNTLGITKDEIREMVNKAVESSVERRLDVLFKQKFESQWQIERIIDQTIRDKSNLWWGESETTLDDYIKTEVVKALLKTVKMNVELVKTNKAATPAHRTRIISRKGVKKNG